MGNKFLNTSILFFKGNIFFILFILTSTGLVVFLHQSLWRIPTLVDWNTIITLSGLLLITRGVKESGFFDLLAYRISRQITNERFLAIFLIFISAILSMFLTNDIALFIVVPLTLSLQDISDSDYSKMVVFEAIAVNVGSSLTPIGNPQNIFLWHQWEVSFPVFIKELAPLVLILSVSLLIFIIYAFPSKNVRTNHIQQPPVNSMLFFLSAILLILFLFAIELKLEKYFLIIIFLSFLRFYRRAILKTNWRLIFIFLVIFIDIGLLSRLQASQKLFNQLNFNNVGTLFFSGALLSQIISNVPAAILLSHYSNNFKIIAYGVNIGGNGMVIGSFANLIALNFIKKKTKYVIFHVYSLSFFILTLAFMWFFYARLLNFQN